MRLFPSSQLGKDEDVLEQARAGGNVAVGVDGGRLAVYTREFGILGAPFDPVHFGILMMTVVTLGSMTPPVGVCMYTVCSLLKTPVEEYIVESIPFVLAVLVEVAFLAFFPQVVLFLPNLLM